jgi:hypothetical protein
MTRESRPELRPSWSFTRLGLLVGVPVAVVLGLTAIGWAAAALKSWKSGDVLTADDLNANFTALNGAFVDLTGDQTIAGTKTFSGNISVGGSLGVGVATFCQDPTTLGMCARTTGQPVGVFDCSCPMGQTIVNGGALAAAATDTIRESRPIATNKWRVACTNAAGGLTDCLAFCFTCARLGS